MKFFIHSYPWLMKQQTWKCKVNVSCASSGIHLLSIFEILGQKLEVLLCIFRGTKILWNELTPPPPSLPPPFCLIRPLIYKFFKLPHYSVFWNLHTPSPICNWRVQTMRLLLSLMSKSQGKENVIRGFNI